MTDAEHIIDLQSALASVQSTVTALQTSLAATESSLASTQSSLEEYKKLARLLQEENERLKRGLLGQKAERFSTNDSQLSLAMLQMAFGTEPVEPTDDPEQERVVAEYTRKQPKRKPLPEALLRVPVEIVPIEVQKEGLDAFDLVGTDVREVLERRAAATVVVQLIYKKFVRKARDPSETTVVFSPDTVEMPIHRGLAGPGMLADTIVRRWQDHQPLNRLEGIYGREGLELARSTICTWHEQLGELVAPLVEAMFADAFETPYLCVDATGVLVLAKEQCRNGHFWVLVAPEKHVLYGYSKRHDSEAVDALLRGYKGYLVADAHAVYDHLYADGEVIEVGCWAHYLEQRVIRRAPLSRGNSLRRRRPDAGAGPDNDVRSSGAPARLRGSCRRRSTGIESRRSGPQADAPRVLWLCICWRDVDSPSIVDVAAAIQSRTSRGPE